MSECLKIENKQIALIIALFGFSFLFLEREIIGEQGARARVESEGVLLG